MDLNQLWQSALNEIELEVSRPNFITWLKTSRLLEKREGVALISLPNNFAKEWVEQKYSKTILGILRNIDDSTKKVEFIVHNKNSPPKPTTQSAPKPASDSSQMIFNELKVDPETNLNPRYSLSSFVVGSANEMCYAAALAVIKDIGKKYNPLFIYGGVGVGKTHLIQGIGNEIKNLYQNKIRSEEHTSELQSQR